MGTQTYKTDFTDRIRISPAKKALIIKSKKDKKQTDAARLDEVLDEYFNPGLFKKK